MSTIEVQARRGCRIELLALLLLALLLVVLGASPWEETAIGPTMESWLAQPQTTDDPIVARVGDVAIPLSLVAAKLALEPATTTPRELLDRLLDQEVLAQEAVRQGLGQSTALRDAWKSAAVQRLLREEFEPISRTQDIPQEVLKQSYQQNHRYFNHGDLIAVSHLLVKVAEGADEASWQAGLELAQQLHHELLQSRPDTKEAFLAQAEVLSKRSEAIRVEELGFVAENSRLVPEFLKATFELGQDGQLSAPVRTIYGWHVIFRHDFKPKRSMTFEEARPGIAEKVWAEWRKMRFAEWSGELESQHRVTRGELDAQKPILPLDQQAEPSSTTGH
ncbi:MAG: hypothetical protein FJ125_04575 [Deltaproteobacteria bacterium]|nr:hypothetical protein [Deltaproteobacteria bacterium]